MLFLVSQVKKKRIRKKRKNETNRTIGSYPLFRYFRLFRILSSLLFQKESGLVAQMLGFWHLFNGSQSLLIALDQELFRHFYPIGGGDGLGADTAADVIDFFGDLVLAHL